MSFITVKPGQVPGAKPGVLLRVMMPPALGVASSRAVPEEGLRVELTPFVQRRLDCGDLVKIDDVEIDEKEETLDGDLPEPPAAAATPAAKPAAKIPAPSAAPSAAPSEETR